jgi:hypothetical protein
MVLSLVYIVGIAHNVHHVLRQYLAIDQIMTKEASRCWVWNLGGLVTVLLAGLVLRLLYAARANLYIDEFTTIWAGQQVLNQGLPRFPLGALYTQGLLYTYLEAAALFLAGGYHPLVARSPSLVLSFATLALLVYAAWSLYRVLPVGLAALWLALDGEAIVWGGRARTYALLQPVIVITFLAWYRGAVADDRPSLRWLAIGLLLVAIVDQQVTLLLLPPMVIWAVVSRGWDWLRKPVVWLQAGVLLLGLAARWLLYGLMVLPGTTATAGPRSFVDLVRPFAEWQTLTPFLAEPNRWLAVLLLAGGVIWLLLRGRAAAPAWRGPVLAIIFIIVFVLFEMVLVVGTTWRRARYLIPLVPLLYLGAEGVAVPALRALAKRLPLLPYRRALLGLTLASVVLVVVLSLPTTRAAAMRNEWGYDRALEAVGDAWIKGDALATFAPAAAFVILGQADYLAAEMDAQVLLVERDGKRLDSWTGLPLLDSPERLDEALEDHLRLWFVVDEMRLERHFSQEYLRLLWDRFDVAAFEWGVFVFRSHPVETPEIDRPLAASFDGVVELESFALSDAQPEPGQTMTVTLRWAEGDVQPVPEEEYAVSVRLLDRAGGAAAGHEAPLLGGHYPVERWQRSRSSQPFPDRHSLELPADLAPGLYRLEAGLHRTDTMAPLGEPVTLDYVQVGEEQENWATASAEAEFGDVVSLLSHEFVGEVLPGSNATLRLVWQTGPRGFDDDYAVFVHLLDAEQQIVQQWDAPPTGGWYPTSYWNPGQIVVDEHNLMFDAGLAPGDYQLVVGLYRVDGTRLRLEDGADRINMATIEIGP